MTAPVDVLIPTCSRAPALAVTLASLCAQTLEDFRVVVSDQTEDGDPWEAGEVQAAVRVLRAQGREVELHKHLPRRGMAEQRQYLLDQTAAPCALFLDDDLIFDPDVAARMLWALEEEECGFVGCAVIGLSFLDDERPHEQTIEFWEGPVEPEIVMPGTPAWQRYRLHNAANLYHVQERLGLNPPRGPGRQGPPFLQRKYRVAWTGGCVMYRTEMLRDAGGFSFWRILPANHCGEDVLAQLRVMACYGGCGLAPSGVYHQQLPTTIEDRSINAPAVLDLNLPDTLMPLAPAGATESRKGDS